MDDKTIIDITNLDAEKHAENAAKRVASYSEKLLHHASILSEKEYQKFLLERLEKDNGYVIRKASDFDRCIVSFDLIERDKLRQYIENPYLYSRVQHTQTLPQEQRGLTIPAEMSSLFPKSSILWQKKSNRYVTFLMREEVTEGFPNNLNEHLSRIQESHRTSAIISRFLLCAQENGKTYDFYKTFVEII